MLIAKGELIARMDADDIACKPRLSEQVTRFESAPGLAVLGTAVYYIDSAGAQLKGPRVAPVSWSATKWRLLFGNCIHHPTVMFRRSHINLPLYDSSAPDAEDYALWLRLVNYCEIRNLPRRLVLHRRHQMSVSYLSATVQLASAARQLSVHLRDEYDIQLSHEDCQTLLMPALWINGQSSGRSPMELADMLFAKFSLRHEISTEDSVAIGRDRVFFALKCAFLSLQILGGKGFARRSIRSIFMSLVWLVRHPGDLLRYMLPEVGR
jgi:hypothetical protein